MKLSLNRETVRVLNSNELESVAGGKVVVIIANPGETEGGGYSDCISFCINSPCDTSGASSTINSDCCPPPNP